MKMKQTTADFAADVARTIVEYSEGQHTEYIFSGGGENISCLLKSAPGKVVQVFVEKGYNVQVHEKGVRIMRASR
jgi:hypothetical protein